LREGIQALHSNWGWFLALGIVLITLGILALGAPLVMTLTTVMLFGVLLVVGGGAEIVSAFWARQWSGFFLYVLSGVLHAVVGVIMVDRPALTAAGFTLMLAVFLMVGGLVRIIVSVVQRFPQWGWVLLNGCVTCLLGILIWRDWPEASLWVIGTFVGVDLLFNGWCWVMLALAARKLPQVKGE
jgi:uncharacterized membrane protein HdeD (DUF308 family)